MLGFTAGMDEFDDERFARGSDALAAAGSRPRGRARRAPAASAPPGPAGRVIRRDGDREELLSPGTGRSAVIRVVARSETGRVRMRREMQLLAALEVGGIGAAPSVLETGDEGYVREDATPLHDRRGRRCAEETTPATGERRAQARARDSLDGLIDALHDHGWVLGAPVGEGLGLRADGTVTVRDLSGLRPEVGTGARLDDRLWVDSVLRDEGRTLRRRIDGGPSPALTPAPNPPTSPAASPPSGSPSAMISHPATKMSGDAGTADEDELDDEERGEEEQDAEGVVGEEAPSVRPLPAPRALSVPAGPRRSSPQRSGPSVAPGRIRVPGTLHRVGEELRAPGLRRVAVLSALAVLIGGGALGSGVWWIAPDVPPPPRAAPSEGADLPSPDDASPGDATPEDDAGGQIADPLTLATVLAEARHDYVTGASGDPIAAPGSPAETADEQVRRAYDDATVEGAAPRVLSARVVGEPAPDGTARLEVETSTPAHTVIEADGTETSAPATGPVVFELELRWSSGSWWVVDVGRTD